MNKLRILSILLIIGCVVACVHYLEVSKNDAAKVLKRVTQMEKLREEQKLRNDSNSVSDADVLVDEHLYIPLKETGFDDFKLNGVNKLSGDSLYVIPTNVHLLVPTCTSDDSWLEEGYKKFDIFVNLIMIALYVAAIVLFIVVLLSFSKTRVFSRKNVKHVSTIGALMLITGVVNSLWSALRIYVASTHIQLEGMAISYGEVIDFTPLLLGLVVLVMCNILQQATVMKEEQDLTI